MVHSMLYMYGLCSTSILGQVVNNCTLAVSLGFLNYCNIDMLLFSVVAMIKCIHVCITSICTWSDSQQLHSGRYSWLLELL